MTGSETGSPALANIEVKIFTSEGTLKSTVYTDSSGLYLANNLIPGSYKVWFGGNSTHLAEYYNDKSPRAPPT